MRVAVFTNQYPSRVSTFFERDIAGLVKSGLECDIFTLYPGDESLWKFSRSLEPYVRSGRIRLFHARMHIGLRSLHRLHPKLLLDCLPKVWETIKSSRQAGVASIARNLWLLPNCWRWAAENLGRYDHVFAYWGHYVATAAMEFRRCQPDRIPLTVLFHAEIDLYLNRQRLVQKLEEADQIGFVCRYNRDFLAQRFPQTYSRVKEKIFFHHPGVDLEEYAFCPHERPAGEVLAVGRLVSTKGFDVLIDAVALLRARGIGCRTTIVGRGPEAGRLQKQIAQLRLNDSVAIKGWQTPAEVRRSMSRCTVLVQPSKGVGDAAPTVIKEAMALGTPVVSTEIAGIPELLDFGRCGLLVPERSPELLADSIERYLHNPNLRMEMAVRAREHAERVFDQWQNGRHLAERLSSCSYGRMHARYASA